MNIELFNKQLALKVTKATNLEKGGDLKNAIDTWLEVSDMSIKFSKTRGIDSSYRNMLIKRTGQIVERIKTLKLKLAEAERIHEEPVSFEKEYEYQESVKSDQHIEDLSDSNNLNNNSNDHAYEELPEVPGEIVEIKASKDFKILTPHEELDMDIFKDNKSVVLANDDGSNVNNEESGQQDHDKNIICFACGYDKNQPNATTCKNCNIELK